MIKVDQSCLFSYIQISLSIKAVPAIIFYSLLPTIPKVSFMRIFSRVAEENKQNY